MKKARTSAIWALLARWAPPAPMALAFAVLTVPTAPAYAQDVEACRCVDRDGNEIENCTCFPAPRIQGILASFGSARPRIGVSVDINQSARNDANGARVTDVLEDGPADDAGIRVGDMITSVDGHSLFDPLAGDAEDDFDLDESIPVQRLLALARDLEPGQEVEVVYVRDSEVRTVVVEADDLSSWSRGFTVVSPNWDADAFQERMRDFSDRMRDFEFRFDDEDFSRRMEELTERLQNQDWNRFRFDAPPTPDVRVFSGNEPVVLSRLRDGLVWGSNSVSGVELMELNPGLGAYFGTSEGVLVTDVDEDSTLGLEAGDVILRVGDREVTTPEQVRRILRSYEDDEEITLHIMRDRSSLSVAGRLSG